MQLSRMNGGIVPNQGFYVNATHIFNISTGDRVCMDVRKTSLSGFYWRIRLGTGGIFLSEPIFNGIYNDTCATSLGSGQFSIVVEGKQPSTNSCPGPNCYGNFSFDNITINTHLCSNGIMDGYETSTDCGGFCGECLPESPEEDLLAKYAPVLYFHPDEQFFPTSIEAMLNESDLKHIVEWEEDYIDDDLPVDDSSLDGRNETYYLDMRGATAGYLSIGPDPARFDNYIRNIYGRQVESGNIIVLQYWFFYPFNDFRGGHEGDWEMIQILLSNETKGPVSSTYSYHYEAHTYNWSEINKIDTHPKVFVSLGGHASYKDPTSIWELATKLGESVSSEGTNLDFSSYNLNKLTNQVNWTHFMGRWGEWNGNKSYYTGPNSPANIAYGDQPNRWNDPIGFAEHSRPTQISASTGSPVNLHAYDSQGRHTGLNKSGEIEAEIPGTYLYTPSDNGKEAIVILSDDDITFVIEATDEGVFNLSVMDFDSATETQIETSYQDVEIEAETVVSLEISNTNPNLILQIDENGDGSIDETTLPTEITIEGDYVPPEQDEDNDGFSDSIDNCPTLYNPNKNTDFDEDGFDSESCGGNDCNDENGAINPSIAETCDNVDNNCNSQIDENLFFTFGTNVGACEYGVQTCSLGVYSITTPSIDPINESCNALDDDCDASTDEELNREYGSDVGECKKGIETCNNSNWGVSIPSKEPSIELCNEKDDDCDGQIDDMCARNTKQYAIEFLEDAKNGISCNKTGFCLDKLLSEAIEDIQKSLDLRYYTDNETLNQNKGKNNGENVFDYEIEAVKTCLRGKWMRSIHSICKEAVDYLAAADKEFAQKALIDSKALSVANSKNKKCYGKEIEKAERFLLKADNVISENFPRIEILNYKKSWEHSQKATEIAKSQKGEC